MDSILGAIGNTPLMKLGRTVPAGCAEIYSKLEFFNPGGSIKDRICLQMITEAEVSGKLKPGGTVIEPTSGNTGIGLALVCAVKKYRLILVMPENYSVERRYIMQQLGAEIVLSPAEKEMQGAIEKVEELSAQIPNSYLPRQFSNPQNPEAHRRTTAQELLQEMSAEDIDALVVGVGTGGTLSGVGEVIKKSNPRCLVVAVEPAKAAVLSGCPPSVHKIQGIGAGFIPEILNRGIIDRVEVVEDEESYQWSKRLARKEGLLVGISSGAAFCAALRVGQELGPEKKVVTFFPDKGERYFSIEKFFV